MLAYLIAAPISIKDVRSSILTRFMYGEWWRWRQEKGDTNCNTHTVQISF